MSELEIALKAVELYASRHPRPVQVTQKQAADMLDVSYSTVRNLVRAGTLKLNQCGMISVEEIDRVLRS